MKMPDLSACVAGALFAAFLCGLCGCSQSVDVPNSSLRRNAMEDYQAGRYDAAFAGFEHVLKNDPKDYLAHFQLAVLMQHERKDYLGALVHYRLYLDMRPEDDKTTQASERMEICKNMLLAANARNAAGASASKPAPSEVDKKQAAENARLSAEVARLQKENKNLRYLLSSLGETGKGRTAALSAEAKKILAELGESNTEEPRRRSVIPTDKELLEDDGEDGPVVSSPAVKDLISKVQRDEATGPARPPAIQKPAVPADELAGPAQPPPIKKPPLIVEHSSEPDPKPVPGGVQSGGLNGLMGGSKKPSGPARPDTYKVQPGDKLIDIARRFYGKPDKWRDIQKANAASIPTTGALKAGQIIKLP